MNRGTYEVIVGNVGVVHRGSDHGRALKCFNIWRSDSIAGYGRQANEPVYLMEKGEPIKEHQPRK